MSTLKSSQVFKVDNLGIGWVDNDFTSRFGDQSFEPRTLGTFHTLTEAMSVDKMLEKGLAKECELGDVHAFLENPPKGTDDGYANLFAIKNSSCVVGVNRDGSGWDVSTWNRVNGWSAGRRVFSPATESKNLGPKPSETDDTLALRTCIATEEIAEQVKRIADALEPVKKSHKRKSKKR